MYRLKHADGKKHLSEYWLDGEFCVREGGTREEAEAFARQNDDCFKLVVVPPAQHKGDANE